MKKVFILLLIVLFTLFIYSSYLFLQNPNKTLETLVTALLKRTSNNPQEIKFNRARLSEITIPSLSFHNDAGDDTKNNFSYSGEISAQYKMKEGKSILSLQTKALTILHNNIQYEQIKGLFEFVFEPQLKLVQSTKVQLESIDFGLSLKNISFLFEMPTSTVFIFRKVRAEIFKGEISLEKLKYNVNSNKNTFTLKFHRLDLKTILDLTGQNQVEATGVLSGSLPVTISNNGVSISKGSLSSHSPGGVIKYKAGGESSNETAPHDIQSLVLKALSNYHYSSLEADVSYETNGDTLISSKLQGKNPDLNKGQAVNVNLNVEQNVLKLLKSLQTKSNIEKSIEKRLGGG